MNDSNITNKLKALSEDAQNADDILNSLLLDSIFFYGRDLVSNKPHFEAVSFEQFRDDMIAAFDEYDKSNQSVNEIIDMYNDLVLPSRSTKNSAGYDFRSPFHFYLKPGESIMIPTGIRAYMPEHMVLMIYPRSGLGTKYRLCLANSTAVIDSDFYNSDNEGHIHIKLVNDGDKIVTVEQGKAFCQGVFTKYYTTSNDTSNGVRNGGMGSTDKH